VQRSQAHDAVKLLGAMRDLAKAVIIALADSDLIEDKPGRGMGCPGFSRATIRLVLPLT
jgi:hypothetical protein